MTLDPQAARVLEAAEQSGLPLLETLSPTDARLQYERGTAITGGEPPAVFSVRDTQAEGPLGPIPLRVYVPREPGDQPLPMLIYIHGGGYVIGSRDSHDVPCRYLALAGDCIVVSVDYRMAPEHPYPEPVDDCWAAVNWIADNATALGGRADAIAVGGDSAGGNLATVMCLKARDEGGPAFVYQLLIYPGTDKSRSHASHTELASGYRLTKPLLDWFMDHYFSGAPAAADDPYASPLRAEDLSGLPPALVISAGYDPLRDEDIAYHDKLCAHGIASEHLHYPGMIHGFINMPGMLDKARECLDQCGARLKAVFASI
ncbi:alpha/beta hydrolase [Salinisphaera aquimarina]|uniref:Alpha/beta hydrolase n=1 Tax=Salinisphaera aquimarina TaxID=2094031 RepID=A0ABV7EVX9_9GAMM